MKKITIITLTIILLGSCNSPNRNTYSLTFAENKEYTTNEKIKNLFLLEQQGSFVLSEKNEVKFFNSLPESFEEFNMIYGKKHDLKDGRRLYLSHSFHFQTLLQNLYYIPKDRVTKNLVNIAIEASYIEDNDKDGLDDLSNLFDAISIYQTLIQQWFSKEISNSIEILNEFGKNDILKFWKFYFAGSNPENYRHEYEELYKRYRKLDVRIANIMKEAYESILENSLDY
ncbi:hypothetical protein MM239_01535 [Belliella sp. DSM 111904]|uniref:DUF4375 domain-containing protein n=1 Tax=Belliella filtrata TaxID=2923435 RepID=A0ABS9UV68_9BACT|nr:hypothetical protein [Belliella filtrata]MCH7408062.1 hypothetical protein [Belliella filtrata]